MYDDVVSTYIRVLKHDSPEAAAAIAQILSIHGSRTALRATLVITLLKMEVEKNHSVENLDVQMQLIQDFPEALALLERAITFCLQAWGFAYSAIEPDDGNLWNADSESTPAKPMLPPL